MRKNGVFVVPLFLSLVGLLWVYDLALRPGLGLFLFLGAGLSFALVLGRLGNSGVPASVVLVGAVLLRLLALPLVPSLSDDIYRYLWDGKITLAGFNPYFLAPEAEELRPLRDSLWHQVAHREVETVYPPFALALFSIATLFSAPLLALKCMLTAIDILSCVLLVSLVRARGDPVGRCIGYAWNPLVVVEVAGMGHVDALGIAPLIAGALLLEKARDSSLPTAGRRIAESAASGVLVALAVLSKLVPLLLLPAWSRRTPRRIFMLMAFTLVLLATTLPFASGFRAPPGPVTYGVSWEFNGPLFEPLWRVFDALSVDRWLKGGLSAIERLPGLDGVLGPLYPFVYSQLLAKLLLLGGLVVAVVVSWRQRDVVAAAFVVFAGMVLFSATVYPWYLIWVLPWAAALGRWPWLVLSSVACFVYMPELLGIPLIPWPFLLMWTPFVVALNLERRTG